MMNKKAILVILSAFFHISLQLRDLDDDFYRAAVVEFASNRRQEDNLQEYEWFIKEAKQAEVDIIVFPENSLHGVDGDVEKKLSEVPDPESKIIPCGNKDLENSRVLEKLSCAAQENAIYTVVNLLERVPCNVSYPDCPGEGRLVYNTDVVFDRKGAVISRYRKFNLRDEYFVSKTDKPDLITFETDFGVKFGIFTSFDILFKSPAIDLVEKYNVTNFIHPSYWYGELPFFTALQVQSGWSYAMNVNLLAAGTSKPSTGTGGSGIYLGRRGPPVFSMPDREMSTALVSRVPKNVRTMPEDDDVSYQTSMITRQGQEKELPVKNRLQFQRDPTISSSRSAVLDDRGTEFRQEICSGSSLCCRFDVSYHKNRAPRDRQYQYRAVAYQGEKMFTTEVIGTVEACAIILCTGPNLEDCGRRPDMMSEYQYTFNKISIEAEFNSNQTMQMPNILLGSGYPDKKTKMVLMGAGHYDFHTRDVGNTRSVRMLLKSEMKSVITFGIYSRDFANSGAFAVYGKTLLVVFSLFLVFSRLNECFALFVV